jgi:hypothetical protein
MTTTKTQLTMPNLSIKDELSLRMTNENLRQTLKLKAGEIPPPPPVPAPSASELCPMDRKPYAPMPPVTDPRWNIWTIGNLGEVERGLTTVLLREVLARADGIRNVHIKKRGKASRAKLVEVVHDASGPSSGWGLGHPPRTRCSGGGAGSGRRVADCASTRLFILTSPLSKRRRRSRGNWIWPWS